jgi:hypothetical protein
MSYENKSKQLQTINGQIGNNIINGSFNGSSLSGGTQNGIGAAFNTNMVKEFDLATINGVYAKFQSSFFDGRYIYMCPTSGHGYFVRYDTTADIGTAGSYTIFDLSTINSSYKGYPAMTFDGRYIYLCPGYNTGYHGLLIRYDTRASFTAAGSYAVYDLTAISANYKGYYSIMFDGTYVYLCPTSNGTTHGLFLRYDTRLSFTSSGSYGVFDISSINGDYRGFIDLTFDGRYVYLCPYNNGSAHGYFIRYDTTATFNATGSYSVFDMGTINAAYKGYRGLCFDGKYIYIAPYHNGSYHGNFIRYDTTQPFTTAGSYSAIDLSGISATYKGFIGMCFDGKYIYLIPYYNGTAYHGNIIRYDIFKTFTLSTSYTILDLAGTNVLDVGYYGASFDGKYIYISPYANSVGSSGRFTRVRVSTQSVF